MTAVAGSIGGIFLVAAWWRFGVLTLCMLCVGLLLGFLVASVVFFTPLGRRSITHVMCVQFIVRLYFTFPGHVPPHPTPCIKEAMQIVILRAILGWVRSKLGGGSGGSIEEPEPP